MKYLKLDFHSTAYIELKEEDFNSLKEDFEDFTYDDFLTWTKHSFLDELTIPVKIDKMEVVEED